MKRKILALLFCVMTLGSLTSCVDGTYVVYDDPYYWEDCYLEYDWYWGDWVEVCDIYYYNQEGEVAGISKDIVADAADKEQVLLETAAEFYANQFNLSVDKGMKLAKTVKDFSALEERTSEDLSEFAERLYGINPGKIASAVGTAQAGNSVMLNEIVDEAAKNFETDTENMKDIVKFLHGKALKDNGINL